MDTSFSEVFNGDVLADKDDSQPSDPSTPAQTSLGSQPATGRQPQGQAGQVARAPVLPFSQMRAGLDSPRPTVGLGEHEDTGFQANATDAFGQPAFGLAGLQPSAESAEARVSRLRLEHMWTSSKTSSLSFRSSIRGGSTTELPFKNIVMWLVSLLPVADLAYTYSNWMKTPISSLPTFVSTMKCTYPQLHSAICDILKLRGEDCRAATEDALDDLFGHFSGQIHSAFIYGVVVYVWVTTDSPRQEELRQMLVRYLSTEQHRMGRFKAQCTTPTTASVTAADFQATYTEAQLQALPGFQRLHPEQSPIGFEPAWALLLQCATETVAQELKPLSADAALDLIGAHAQFPRQPAGETIPQFFGRLMKAYKACRSALSSLKKLHLLPHPDTLSKLVASNLSACRVHQGGAPLP